MLRCRYQKLPLEFRNSLVIGTPMHFSSFLWASVAYFHLFSTWHPFSYLLAPLPQRRCTTMKTSILILLLVLTISTVILARPAQVIREPREASPEPQRRRWNRWNNRRRQRISNRRQGIPTELLALKAGVGLGLVKAGLLSGGLPAIPAEKVALGVGLAKGFALASILNNGK